MNNNHLNSKVTAFLDNMALTFRDEIEYIRTIILSADFEINEGIKWNAPNYSVNGKDRITLRINSPKQLQVIFHRGAKVQEQPKNRILSENYNILLWKENDRAIASFTCLKEIQENSLMLKDIVTKWLEVTR